MSDISVQNTDIISTTVLSPTVESRIEGIINAKGVWTPIYYLINKGYKRKKSKDFR